MCSARRRASRHLVLQALSPAASAESCQRCIRPAAVSQRTAGPRPTWWRLAAAGPAAQDLAEVEEAVGQHIWPLDTLGAPTAMLRALRPLLFLDTAALGGSPLLGQLPASCVVHHLYSRAPAELQGPHQRSGLNPAQVPHPTRMTCWWLAQPGVSAALDAWHTGLAGAAGSRSSSLHAPAVCAPPRAWPPDQQLPAVLGRSAPKTVSSSGLACKPLDLVRAALLQLVIICRQPGLTHCTRAVLPVAWTSTACLRPWRRSGPPWTPARLQQLASQVMRTCTR